VVTRVFFFLVLAAPAAVIAGKTCCVYCSFGFLFIIIFFLIHRKTSDLDEPNRKLFDIASSIVPYKYKS
jgi:hypothetical protein